MLIYHESALLGVVYVERREADDSLGTFHRSEENGDLLFWAGPFHIILTPPAWLQQRLGKSAATGTEVPDPQT